MIRLRRLVTRGLAATAARWPAIRRAYHWVHRLAHVLAHPGRRRRAAMRRRVRGVLGAVARGWPTRGPWPGRLRHFLKVTRSDWPGLFWCYDDPDLPPTNNDLEHLFGAHRYHERRASGRKGASPATVVRGAVRVLAAAATRVHPVTGAALAPRDVQRWRSLRTQLADRRHARTLGHRFRQHPEAYLRALERLLLIKASLPS